MTNEQCERCGPRDDSFTFRCFDCRQVHHLHLGRWGNAKAGDVVAIECPSCTATNAVRKPVARVLRGDRLVVHSVQPELEL